MRNSVLAILGLVAGNSAFADVRYEYTGSQVGLNAISVFSPTDFVQSYFVLATPPISGNFDAADFVDFGTSIGSFAIGKQSGADIGAHFEFALDGTLTSWSFVIDTYSTPTQEPSLVEVWSNSVDLAPSGDRVIAFYEGRNQLGATATEGQWNDVTSVVPEPETIALFSIGLISLLAGTRRQAK